MICFEDLVRVAEAFDLHLLPCVEEECPSRSQQFVNFCLIHDNFFFIARFLPLKDEVVFFVSADVFLDLDKQRLLQSVGQR